MHALDDDLLTVSDVARALPRRSGRKVSAATIWRWLSRGCRGVRLASVLIGGRRLVPRSALEAFVDQLSEQRPHAAPPSAESRNGGVARRAREDAEADALGL